jgi:hypothetical protein
MRKFPFRNITLWLTILTLLWSSQGQGYVWCVVADGPTHLESSLESHCGSCSSHSATPEQQLITFGDEDSSCSPCFDLAATHDTLQQRTLSNSDLSGPFLPSTSIHPQWESPSLVRHLANKLILEALPRVATTLLVHRTIVLLI